MVSIEDIDRMLERRDVDGLIGCLNNRNASVRWNAAFALGKIGDERAIPALEKMLDDYSTVGVLDETEKDWHQATVSAVAKEAIDKLKPLQQQKQKK
ncbi:MAG: HEAT repeat domain-containing protein [Candidatus Thermoplasmatota archaeon]